MPVSMCHIASRFEAFPAGVPEAETPPDFTDVTHMAKHFVRKDTFRRAN